MFFSTMLLLRALVNTSEIQSRNVQLNVNTFETCEIGDLLWKRVKSSAEGGSVKQFLAMVPQAST